MNSILVAIYKYHTAKSDISFNWRTFKFEFDKPTLDPFKTVSMEMIRKAIPRPSTIASQIVGVQPMTGPIETIYKLKTRDKDAK